MRGQHAGGLVHDQQLGVLQQAANDLDPLAFTGTQITNNPRRIKGQAIKFGDLGDLGGQITLRGGLFHAQRDVFRHVQGVEQRKVLKYHRNAGLSRGAWVRRAVGLVFKGHRAAVRMH